jgi:ribosome-associated protein
MEDEAPPQAVFNRATFEVPRGEVRFEFMRSGGPGGQNVNKVNSKARVRWNIAESYVLPPEIKEVLLTKLAQRLNKAGELCVESEKERSQDANKKRALQRLDEIVRNALKPRKRRVPTKPSRASKERRLDGKRRKSKKKSARGGIQDDEW